MTQTSPPTSPSDAPRARPQLFGASPSPQPRADFENSILATIDGGQARLTRKTKRPRKSRVPMLLLSAAALGAGVYAMAQISPPSFSMAWFQGTDSPEAAPVMVAPPPAMPDTQVAQAEPAPDTPAPGAAIEVVPAPPVAEAAPPLSPPEAARPEASDGMPAAPLALSTSKGPPLTAQTEPPAPAAMPVPPSTATTGPASPAQPAEAAAPLPEARTTPRPPAQAEVRQVRQQTRPPAPPPKSKTRVAKKPVGTNEPGAESDTALLAAVLPHFQRPEPTSRAFEQRCGQLTGSAAASCRRRFCSGRQGADTACPDPEAAPLPTAPADSFE